MKKSCKEPSHLNKNRSTCKADLSAHLHCSRLSPCCSLTCKPLACLRSMQVYRYSSQTPTEQPKYKELQKTAKSTPSELTKRRVTSRCGGVASAFSIELLVHYLYHYSLKTIRGLTRTALRVSCGSPRPDLSRLRRVPAAEIETKSCGCDTKCSISFAREIRF